MLSLESLRAARSKRRLTKEEKQAYIEYWQSSNQSQRLFCKQEGLSVSTFSSWLQSLAKKSLKVENKGSFIAVELNSPSVKDSHRLILQFKLPNGLFIEGCFSFSEVSRFIKEVSDGFTSLR